MEMYEPGFSFYQWCYVGKSLEILINAQDVSFKNVTVQSIHSNLCLVMENETPVRVVHNGTGIADMGLALTWDAKDLKF